MAADVADDHLPHIVVPVKGDADGVPRIEVDALATGPQRIRRRIARAAGLFGADRILLTPDCGFATFADNPVSSAATAEAKLRAIVAARDSYAARG